jgi:replicative DNA helicase
MCAEPAISPAAVDFDRIPPHDLEAERCVLGACMLDDRAIDAALDHLKTDAFHQPGHRLVFSAICTLRERQEPCDMVTVSSLLQTQNKIELAGGAAYIAGLASAVPTTANIEHYVKIVEDKWTLRQLLRASQVIAADCFRGDEEVEKTLEAAEQLIFQIAERRPREGFLAINRDSIGKALEFLEKQQGKQGGLSGVGTGFEKLDELTTGLHAGELIIVGARPSVGKTAFALNVAEHVATSENRAVAIFTLEMTAQQLIMRMLSSHAHVDGQRMRRGTMTVQDWTAIMQAGALLGKAEIYVDETPQLSPLEVNARCRRLKAEKPNLALVIVDYIQLMNASGRTIENRQQEISYISRSLKALARELRLPVMALCQLNRESEKGRDVPGRPQLSQLRESGAIEQDADVVLLLYRPGMHNQDPQVQDRAEVILAKQRNGPIGVVTLQYLSGFARFGNPPPHFFDNVQNE